MPPFSFDRFFMWQSTASTDFDAATHDLPNPQDLVGAVAPTSVRGKHLSKVERNGRRVRGD
jgi:hypothetical protein